VDDAPVRAPGIARTESERQERERRAILEALEATGWNRQAAAARLGIPRRTFYRRLDAYGILVAGSNGDA
jgi:transcriptional regulator of acetoin/glycerol metabolism